MFNHTSSNIEALQSSPQLQCLELTNHPQDEQFDQLSKLTRLAFDSDFLAVHPSTCHLSAVMKLCCLTRLIELECVLVMDGVQYFVENTSPDEFAGNLFVSVPDASATFGLALTRY